MNKLWVVHINYKNLLMKTSFFVQKNVIGFFYDILFISFILDVWLGFVWVSDLVSIKVYFIHLNADQFISYCHLFDVSIGSLSCSQK